MAERTIALVTGASRGIGARMAVRLGERGFDLVITARTVNAGEEREHSSTVAASDTRPLPGSLSETRAAIEATGARCMVFPADLLDRASLGALAAAVEARWGPVTVLVNNGRYVGPGQLDHIVDTPLHILDRHLEANVMGPIVLIRAIVPGMLACGGGRIINITSPAGFENPPGAAGQGGWGLGYAISKGAFGRIAGVLDVELGDQGIVAVNVNPGFVPTERMKLEAERFGFDLSLGDSPEVAAAAVAWLASDPEAVALRGSTVHAADLCREHDLLAN
jgi:NAD(P)-dependent dehydrogenase (short-subunit alcohol dehydrogenase family)